MSKSPSIFFRLTKVDEAKREVYGIATAEVADKTGEICDYETTVPYYKAWSSEIEKASNGKSLGNVREMHDTKAVGKLIHINFDDDNKQIEVGAKIVEESTWQKVIEGVLTGFSQGGSYVKTWKDKENPHFTRYTADPAEISVVDNPCLGVATFEYIKADGSTEMRKFHTVEAEKPVEVEDPKQVWLAKDGSTHATKIAAKKHNATVQAEAISKAAAAPAAEIVAEINAKLGDDTSVEPQKAGQDDKEIVNKADAKLPRFIEKGLDQVARAACLIQELDWLHSSISYEAESEGDNSPQPGKLMEIIKELGEFLRSLCEEETTELVSGKDDDEVMEMANGIYSDVADAIRKALGKLEIKTGTPMGKLADELLKAGARHSKTDAAHLNAMNDHMDKMGKHIDKMTKCHGAMADCMKGLGMDDEKSGEDAEKMQLTATNEALTKTISELTATLDSVNKRLEHVEKSPAPSKVAVLVKDDEHKSGKDARESTAKPLALPAAVSPEMFRARNSN